MGWVRALQLYMNATKKQINERAPESEAFIKNNKKKQYKSLIQALHILTIIKNKLT